MRRRAFTLVELLVVIAILAILFALLFPVFISARAAVHQMGVSRSAKQISTATIMYMADSDDVYPLAMYMTNEGVLTWFGLYQGDEVDFDSKSSLIRPYIKGDLPRDPTLVAERYFGDWTGIGYNWGVIGSDFHVRADYTDWPNCRNAARGSELEDPSSTVVFATSGYYATTWAGGDGAKYLFGFFDPPSLWNGVPNVDFRHLGETVVDEENRVVRSTGNAIVARSDGSTITAKQEQLEERFFWRYWQGEE